MNFGLGDIADMLSQLAHTFAAEEFAPRLAAIEPADTCRILGQALTVQI